jgi:hypothetical protein
MNIHKLKFPAYLLLLFIFSITLLGCEKTLVKIRISNTLTYLYNDPVLGPVPVNWDVRVVINNVDYGIVYAGDVTDYVEIRGRSLHVDAFDVQISSSGKGLFYEMNNGTLWWVSKDYTYKSDAVRGSYVSVPVNRDSWTWEVGFGAL